MLGADFVERWGPTTGVLVKLLSPRGQVPVHAHPTREWAQRHLSSRFGKTVAWVLLVASTDREEAAHAGIGFTPTVSRDWFGDAVRRHDNAIIRGALHRTEVRPGEVYVAHSGVPHYLGPGLSFIEVQEPTDHIVIAETSGEDDAGATMGLGWDVALDMLDYSGVDAQTTFARARQEPRVLRAWRGSREVRLVREEVLQFFDVTALEVSDEIDVSDGRFSIAIVVAGQGAIEGDFGSLPISRGITLALPASLAVRIQAGEEAIRIIRCLGPIAQ
jgi:mannose-6-phosphate isomerase